MCMIFMSAEYSKAEICFLLNSKTKEGLKSTTADI